MPIIDPSIQLALCINEMETVEDNNFFLYYLYQALQNKDRTLDSIEAYFQFEKDFQDNWEYPNDIFKLNYNFNKDFDNPSIHKNYDYLYSKFRPEESNNISEIHKGQYFVYENDRQVGHKIIRANFFRPVLSKSSFHAWYFTDSPVAILCVNLLSIKRQDHEPLITDLELYLINLEIDLIVAAGYTLVLSFITDSFAIQSSPSKKIYVNNKETTMSIQEYFIYKTVVTHNFSEIHLNLTTCNDKSIIKNYDLILNAIISNANDFSGHFYIYSPFFKESKSDSDALLKILKNKPRFHIFNFSDDICSALNLGQLIGASKSEFKCQTFSYFKTGFDHEHIRIMLCNVPIYSDQDNENNTLPSEVSYLSWAYISREDFLSWSGYRVPIILDDNSNSHHFLERFISSDDIHEINPQFFVNDTLYLTRTSKETLEIVNQIQEKSKDMTFKNEGKDFEKSKVRVIIKPEKYVKKILTKVINVLQCFENKFLYKNQIFTAFEACNTCFINNKNSEDKGFIYQVETGEGKSFIIRTISAVISLLSQSDLFSKIKSGKKYVHVASSNIQLSNRDYIGSRNFFKKLGLSSAVLLHQNELPYYKDEAKKKEMENDYPEVFFKDNLFENSSNMNYSICGISTDGIKGKRADIIFSTFVNFESLYLRMVETCSANVGDYFRNCYLLIDEADSILIDELANGTILSRSMKTNCEEVLNFVYKAYLEGIEEELVLKEVKLRWPKCRDLKLEDIKDMFDDINLVRQEEFTNGKKYSIETREEGNNKNKNKKKHKKSSNKKVEEKAENQEKVTQNDNDNENLEINNEYTTSTDLSSFVDEKKEKQDDNDDDDDKKVHKKHHSKNHKSGHKKDHKKEHKKDKNKTKIYKEIVPFDYDHKGVLEPNKEFSGFVQQFIAIKEKTNNKDLDDLKIKDVSMNYLYVSHPIFVKLYKAVCGFTGTIGNKYDKQILKKQYKLITKKIPRNRPNRRIELPIVLCNDLEERNRIIVNEILEFHEKEIPILVIFQDLNEISNVYEILIACGVEYVNIFDGKDEKIKPDDISGKKGAISLGTNVCGRGTDIKNPEKPLHVIISYFTSNSRVMQQAFGRTSRQGRDGTVTIICLKSQFISPIEIAETEEMDKVLQDFQIKNEMQQKFIEEFRKYRSWIFDGNIVKQKIDDKYIKLMRSSKINVNRIKACDFEFPICMSVQTFVIIQGQKIFSLYNCPNCLYTWILFQRYCRELILESWSLFIDRADKTYMKLNEPKVSYKDFLKKELEKIMPWLHMYLPIEKYKNKENEELRKFGIIDTFIEIFDSVSKWGEKKIESVYPKKLMRFYSPEAKQQFITFNVGFKPFTLRSNSGARINTIDGKNEDRNYISDPELKYKISGSDNESLSITRKIDGIFEKICEKINEIVGNYTGLKFFLRRTLGGCEFGVCFDFKLRNTNKILKNDTNCIIDIDPLFMFTIILKSIVPILAGVLIIGLIYIAKIAAKISEFVINFPGEITKELVKTVVKEVVKRAAEGALKYPVESFCKKIVSYLTKVLQKQLATLRERKPEMEEIFQHMLNILSVQDFSNVGDKLQELFTEKVCNFKISSEFCSSFLPCGLPIGYLLKIGLLLLLCFASFMMNFNCRKDELNYDEKEVAYKYNKNQDTDQCEEENKNVINNEDFVTINE